MKGFTKLMAGVPEELRGTYAGLASEAAIKHLTDLGVTAVELLPMHYHADERFLVDQGRGNYWGYNTLGFFAPDPRYFAASDPERQIAEFKSLVRALHGAGIEVILDVVYNHTAEGNQMGPTLSWRGIDNRSYYNLSPGQAAVLHGFHGLRQHAQHAASADAAADHGQPAVLGDRDAHRRLPVRPGGDAGPHAARRRSHVRPSSASSIRTPSSRR